MYVIRFITYFNKPPNALIFINIFALILFPNGHTDNLFPIFQMKNQMVQQPCLNYVFSNFSAKPRGRASRDSLYQTPNFKTKNLVYISQDNNDIEN